MSILLTGRFDAGERDEWLTLLRAALPDETLVLEADADVDIAIVANPPRGALQGLPKLALIQSLWAGVDKLLADDSIPAQVPIARMVDPAMNEAMAETALWAVLSLQRDFFDYARQQAALQWRPHPQRRADELPVLVLGRGQMGSTVARRLAIGEKRKADPAEPVGDPPERLVPGGDPEIDLIRRENKRAFNEAVRDALAVLTPESRTLLRLSYLERVGIDKLAVMFQIHRATAARRVVAAGDALRAETLRLLKERLGLNDAGLRSFIGAMSDLHISIAGALLPPQEP